MNKNLINIGKKANKALNSKINQKLKNKVLHRFGIQPSFADPTHLDPV